MTPRRLARRRPSGPRHSQRGAVLVFALLLMLVVTVIGVAMLRSTGNDRIQAARMGARERGVSCAEAGLQYGRRFFGATYETSHGWNDYLNGTTSGYRYTAISNPDSLPLMTRGDGDNDNALDPGTDLDGDGHPDFWVSIRDDDDERPLGISDDPARDNNEAVILRSECTNPALSVEEGGQRKLVYVEGLLVHVQGGSGYGNAQITSNSPDIVGTQPLAP